MWSDAIGKGVSLIDCARAEAAMQRAYYCTSRAVLAFAEQEYEEGSEWVAEATTNTEFAVMVWTGDA